MDKQTEELDVFCRTCNRIVMARVRAVAHGEPTIEVFNSIDPNEHILSRVAYKLAFCIRCESVFLIRAIKVEDLGEFTTPEDHEVLYPRERDVLPEHVPTTVRRTFESALSCFRVGAYEPCAIMCRKSLEALCRELGESGGTLAKRLSRLSDSGRIDQRLASWSNELRLIGNDAAHDIDLELSQEDAQDGLDFVEAILQNLFVLKHKFQEFSARRIARGA